MDLDYVDIFYSHRMDPDTPLEETMTAVSDTVKMGKALYVGISNYSPEKTREAAKLLRELGTPCLIHQPKYSMLVRGPETEGLFEVLQDEGIGCINFSPKDGKWLFEFTEPPVPAGWHGVRWLPHLEPATVLIVHS